MKAIPHFGNAPPHFRADKVLQVTLKERSTVREQKLLQIVGSFQGNLFFGDMDMSILIWADFPGVVPVGLGAPWTSDTPKKRGNGCWARVWEAKEGVVLEQDPWDPGRLRDDAGQGAKILGG